MSDVAAISKWIEFDAGHRVPNHKSKCRNLHGHRYRVEVSIMGPVGKEAGTSDEGMVKDFGDLKEHLTRFVHDRYDHGLILYQDDPVASLLLNAAETSGMNIVIVDWIPTAENLAVAIWKTFAGLGYRSIVVTVWETPSSSASFNGGYSA